MTYSIESLEQVIKYMACQIFIFSVFSNCIIACVAWRLYGAGCTSGKAAKFVREARENER